MSAMPRIATGIDEQASQPPWTAAWSVVGQGRRRRECDPGSNGLWICSKNLDRRVRLESNWGAENTRKSDSVGCDITGCGRMRLGRNLVRFSKQNRVRTATRAML